jgi:ADP-ribosylglycohydrolase
MTDAFPSEWQLREELTALEEEGYEVAEARRRLGAIAGNEGAVAERQAILRDVLAAPSRRPGFAYEEPSDLAGIRAARPAGPRRLKGKLTGSKLRDHTLGAWLGRSAGCLLGKPCEGWHRRDIEAVLRMLGEWPLRDYWPRRETLPEGLVFWGQEKPEGARYYPSPNSGTLRGNITRMERDDDMDYPIIGLAVLEERGPGFTTRDVGNAWLGRLPYHCVYTAERVTYKNLVDGLAPPETAAYRNPYREWIGAQIRADVWGWVAPGEPEFAAELAFRDASLSHTKNGIYGEMFFAALLSAAFVEPDLHALIEIGLSEIPANCRLREAVLDTVRWCAEDATWEATWDKISAKYGHYHGVHTINNAAVVLMGPLHAKGDYEKAIAIAVMGGWDTDCNGATAGSVMGTLLGAKALPEKWIAPLHNRISSIVIGYTDMKISELAKRTGAIQKQVRDR